MFEDQGSIGRKRFEENGLTKLVDHVSPSVQAYRIDKNETTLVSAKTTLRERWQQVPEEMTRTAIREIFLATLDSQITDDMILKLYESNVRPVVTTNLKNTHYARSRHVLTYERLIETMLNQQASWDNYDYTAEEAEAILRSYTKKINCSSGWLKEKFIAQKQKLVEQFIANGFNVEDDNVN